MIRAADADCCWRNSMIQFRAKLGMGTIKSKKQRGKRNNRKVLAPKQNKTLASHQATIENILSDNRTSSDAVGIPHRAQQAIAKARVNRTNPGRELGCRSAGILFEFTDFEFCCFKSK